MRVVVAMCVIVVAMIVVIVFGLGMFLMVVVMVVSVGMLFVVVVLVVVRVLFIMGVIVVAMLAFRMLVVVMLVVVMLAFGMLLVPMILITMIMVVGFEQRVLAEIQQRYPINLKKRGHRRAFGERFNRAFQPRRKIFPDPEHKISFLKRFRLRWSQTILVRRCPRGNDKVRRSNAFHNARNEGMNRRDVGCDAGHIGHGGSADDCSRR